MTRSYSQQRYLAAKRTVDDRSLDRGVLAELDAVFADATDVVEVGAGIGTMFRRLLDRELLPDGVTYTLVDIDADSIRTARERLPSWASEHGYAVTEGESITLRRDGRQITVETAVADATAYLSDVDPDVLVGAAFLDLLEPSAVDALFGQLSDGCHCYFPITFDGGTTFQPPVSPGFDEQVIERYHEDMYRRDIPGNPHAGRDLLARAAADHTLVAAGASDWVVTPDDRGYPADEAYFLHHIVDTVVSALADDPTIDRDRLRHWSGCRHEQVARGDLLYVAHQLDVLLAV